jgi:hypothetical protein
MTLGILALKLFNSETILSQGLSEVSVVEIIFISDSEKKTGIRIADSESINELLAPMLNKLPKTRKHPNHNDSIQLDWDAELIVHYKDTHNDRICITKWAAYRFLESTGRSGDPGYVFMDIDGRLYLQQLGKYKNAF